MIVKCHYYNEIPLYILLTCGFVSDLTQGFVTYCQPVCISVLRPHLYVSMKCLCVHVRERSSLLEVVTYTFDTQFFPKCAHQVFNMSEQPVKSCEAQICTWWVRGLPVRPNHIRCTWQCIFWHYLK